MELMKLDIQKFASSGTLGTLSGSYKTTYTVTWSLLSQSTSNNTSTIRLTATLYTGNSTTISSSYSTFKLDGTTVYSGSYSFSGSGTKFTKTKDITVTHNSNGSFPNRTVSFSTNDYIMGSQSGSGTISGVPSIARYPVLSSGQNFTDEGNPTLTFTNPAKTFPIRVKLEAGGNNKLITRDIDKSSTSYTFNLTEEERNKLRKLATTNSLTVTETVCAMSGSTELSSSYKNYTMTIVNGNPVFNDFVFEDINEQTLALTGDNQNVIAGYSDVKVTIPVANKAVAQKQATMSKYRFNSIDANYSDSNDVSITSNKVTNGDFTVYAIDSRGNSKSVIKNATNVINYSPLTKDSIVIQRQNGVSPITTLKFNGKWWNGIFGQREIINSGTESGNLRNIRPGEDLSGKTIYFRFSEEPNLHIQIEKVAPQTILQTEDGTIIHSAVEEDENYSYAVIYFNNDYVLRKRIDNASGSTISKRVMPSNCGAITYLNQDAIGYEQIYVAEETITYEDVNNTIKARYRYSIAGEENYIIGETPIELTIDGENFSFEGLIKGDLGAEGFDISNAYNIQVIVDDELSQVVFTANLGSGTPHIAYAKNGIGIMGKYDDNVGGLFQIAGKKISENIGQMIRVYNTTEQTISPNTTTRLNFNAIYSNTGNSLVLNDNKIIIGKGINCVLINGRWTKWGTYSKYIYVYKNGVGHSFNITTAGTVETCVVLPVKEGDYIELFCYQESGSNVNTSNNQDHTFLQVTVLG